MEPSPATFRGTDRFALLDRVGEGGMGVVYRAHDRERDAVVALKTLTRASASAIYQLKKEFRGLADLVHPNVVQLYELVCADGHWFFTMELVDGVPFIDAVLGAGGAADTVPALPSVGATTEQQTPRHAPNALTLDATSLRAAALREAIAADSAPSPRPRSVPPAAIASDFAELRAAVLQLADGLSAIHAAGKLHCDIKPSNVLVGGGRVVILDFGISMDWTPGTAQAADSLRGTPEYMAPEQAMYMASSPASDWYSVGVMLYEALTGRLPFEGAPLSIMLAKQRAAPPRPGTVAPGVPEDLDQLCMALLARDAAARPAGPRVRALLTGSSPPPVSQSRPTTPRTADDLFIGRTLELETLRKAAEQTMLGEPLTVWVSGRSGMGKTALVERFLGELRRGGLLVLSGRCYERESVPYKAFDSLIDAVSRHLAQLPAEELGALMPRHIRELSILFPVLRSVPSVDARARGDEHDALEPHELRRRAFAALRQLFAALGARRPMVLHVDDVQWGDAESATLLSALLSDDPLSPQPRLLLLLVFRSEHAEESPLLAGTRHLREGRAGTRHLELGEIGDADAVEIARRLLGGVPRLEEQVASIAREARGSPFFLSELVRYEEERDERRACGDPASRRAVSLEQVLLTRVARLPDDARRLLETLCIAGGPLPVAVAMRAAGLEITGPASLAALRAVKLARTHARGLGTEIEPFHDRIRETVADSLAERMRRELAGHLAAELAASGADAETVLEQFLAAGEPERAAAFARTAADKAQESLAFDRAARLYAVAIELRGGDAPWPLLRAHAEALSFAGRGREAGAAWLAASRAAPEGAATEDRRLAAEQLLKTGDEAAGTRLLRDVCAEVGLFFPGSAQAALAALLYHRARLELTRERFRERAESELDEALRRRADVAFTGAVGFFLTDPVRGAAFSALHLRLALESGVPFRICRGLALEAAGAASMGESGQKRSRRLARAARDLARRLDDPEVVALAKLTESTAPFFLGRWRDARRDLDEVLSMLRDRCRGVAFEIASARYWSCNSLILCGELAELARRVPSILDEATQRGDRYALAHMVYAATVARIVSDDVSGAQQVIAASPAWSSGGFTSAHWSTLISEVGLLRYRGRGRAALARLERDWDALGASHLLRVQALRVFAHFERGLSAVAAFVESGEARLLLSAERDAERVAREDTLYARGMAGHLRACIHAARGRERDAARSLRQALAGLVEADLGYLAACLRRRLGELEPESAAAGDAARYFTEQGVRNPARCAAMTAPGFPDG